MIVVSDATPLIAFAKLNRLALLKQLFGVVLIPQAVYDEVANDASGRPGSIEVRQADWIKQRAVTDFQKLSYLRAELDPGEAEALVLAQELSADWILLDEPKARLAEQFLGVHFIGTVGLLLLAKQSGQIPAIRPLLDDLRANKFHLSDRLYQFMLQKSGELDDSN